MSVAMYKCRQCGRMVTSDIIALNNEDHDWFLLFENVVCSKKCNDARERFFKSLLI